METSKRGQEIRLQWHDHMIGRGETWIRSDEGGGTGQKERKTEVEVDGLHKGWFDRDSYWRTIYMTGLNGGELQKEINQHKNKKGYKEEEPFANNIDSPIAICFSYKDFIWVIRNMSPLSPHGFEEIFIGACAKL